MAYTKVFRTRVDDDTWKATLDYANARLGGNISEVIRIALVSFLEAEDVLSPEIRTAQMAKAEATSQQNRLQSFKSSYETWKQTRSLLLLKMLKEWADNTDFITLPFDAEMAYSKLIQEEKVKEAMEQ